MLGDFGARRGSGLPAAALVAALGLALASCGSDETSLLVEVTSDLTIPGQVDALQIDVTGDVSGGMANRFFELSTAWPHSVSIRPGAVENQAVTISVTAMLGGGFVARRLVRSAFVAGEQVVVRVHIPAACASVRCAEGEDCVDGDCVPVVPADGGPRDAGQDAPWPDGGLSDGGCAAPEDCDDGVLCTVDICFEGGCQNEPDDTRCAVGSTCDPVEGCPPRVCMVDPDCSDGVSCNGSETCLDGACQPGATVDCNDSDDCTTDRCDEGMRGKCVYTTRDADGDTFGDAACPEAGGVPATDCNDADPGTSPDAPEICNGADDDCASGCDDAFTCCRGATESCMTSCGTTGNRTCGASCGWSVCAAPAETCNGLDDDCNGAPDDVYACVRGASMACTTSCGSSGTRSCLSDCTWSACMPPTERCGTGDDDCDTRVDEGFACVRGSSMACTTTCASTGSRTCGSSCTYGSCTPPTEACNGRDDDCDTRIDETVTCTAGMMGSCTTSCGSTGSRTCSAMCTWGTCSPPAEACNGGDDDCDGRIDETFACIPGTMGSCSTSCGTGGSRSCTASCAWGTCNPPIESCNGSDDDCDSMCDEIFACCAGSTGSCTTTCGSTGSRTCGGTCGWSACSPPARETCNGTDDDCNSVCDDGFACCRGSTGSCTTSCGTLGTRTCSASCAWGATCTPPAEECNGYDDDCDTNIDEGVACSPGEVGSCTTTCGSTGTRDCDFTCNWLPCTPPAEACNGRDDNCDGSTDEGCAGCLNCGGAVTAYAPGGRYMVPLTASAHTGTCGGAGTEGYLSFTTTGTSDVFITTHQAGTIDTVLYARSCTCTGAQVGCNDDADGRTTSVLRLTSLAAGTYNVFVDTKTPMSGMIPVDVYISPTGAASDRCGNPTFLAAGTSSITGDTCAFNEDEIPALGYTCDYFGPGESAERVFYFYVPTSRTVTFDGCAGATDYDSTIFVRDVCSSGALSDLLECNDDSCSTLSSYVSLTLGPGLYFVFPDGYGGDCGNYEYDVAGI